MSSQSTSFNLSVTGKLMRRQKENGLRSEEDLRMQVIRRMWDPIRSSIQLIKDMGISLRSGTRVMVGVGINVNKFEMLLVICMRD